MRRLSTLLACGLLIGSATAQETGGTDRVLVPAARSSAKPYFLWPDDLADYKGEYYLSNGKRMYINRIGRRLYAHIGKQKEHEIRPTGEHLFEAIDGTMSLNIVISRQGYVSGRIAYIDEEASPTTANYPPLVFVSLAAR
ncbi:hypothetical protein [Pseudoduganella sp. RAF53_2]|uniref:hypothetical protein n=1 Tax=unclassified Pseudoduganella TaxID=2637179 RepID=UPI003F9E9901